MSSGASTARPTVPTPCRSHSRTHPPTSQRPQERGDNDVHQHHPRDRQLAGYPAQQQEAHRLGRCHHRHSRPGPGDGRGAGEQAIMRSSQCGRAIVRPVLRDVIA